MNQWDIKPVVICEADDFCDHYTRNGLNFILYWKAKYPKFKITLFTIPEKTSKEMLDLVKSMNLLCVHNWIEIAQHGWNHESNFECYGWDYDTALAYLKRAQSMGYSKIFKAPGWSITPDTNGYPAAPEDKINQDKLAVYKALKDMDYIIFDRIYNKGLFDYKNIVIVDDVPEIVHMHTWNMMTPDENGRNGFEQVEIRGVPWDDKTEFYTITEAYNKELL